MEAVVEVLEQAKAACTGFESAEYAYMGTRVVSCIEKTIKIAKKEA